MLFFFGYIGRSVYSKYNMEMMRNATAIIIVFIVMLYYKHYIRIVIFNRLSIIILFYHLYILLNGLILGNADSILYYNVFNLMAVYYITFLSMFVISDRYIPYVLLGIAILYIGWQMQYLQNVIPIFGILQFPMKPMDAALHSRAAHGAIVTLFVAITFINSNKYKYIGILIIILSYFTLFITAARTMLLASIIYIPAISKKLKYVTIYICMALVIIITTTNIYQDRALQRYRNIYYSLSQNRAYASYEDPNITFRKEHVQYLYYAWIKHPIFGKGYGEWSSIYTTHSNIIGVDLSPHSGIMLTLAELGILGIVFLCLITKHTAYTTIKYIIDSYPALIAKCSAYAIFANYIIWISGDGVRRSDIYILWGICIANIVKRQIISGSKLVDNY